MMKIKAGQNMVLSEKEREEMMSRATKAYGEFLTALGYDWENDPSMQKTPYRVAKVFVKELGGGAYDNPPKITVFPNENGYDGIVFQGGVEVRSFCAHHILPFFGTCDVAYIPKKDGNIIGLSKLNRIVDFLSRRPQTQEYLCKQIHDYLNEILGENQGIFVHIRAEHTCVKLRGVEDNSEMQTTYCSGYFKTNEIGSRDEVYKMIENCSKK